MLNTRTGKALSRETVRFLTARHEAAHAVVAHALGLELGRMSIDEDEARSVRDDLGAFSGHEFGTYRENALCAIAGRLQDLNDQEALGIDLDCALVIEGGEHNDEAHFKTFLLWLADGDEERAKALVKPAMDETTNILNGRLAQHKALAQALADRGALEEPEILEILGPYPEVSPETLAEREATRAKHTPAE